MINRIKMIGFWKILKGKFEQKISVMSKSKNNIRYLKGREDELIGKIMARFGKSRSEALKIINKRL